jgi:hypothetical protein
VFATDPVEMFLQRQALQLVERQAGEQLDPTANDQERVAERALLLVRLPWIAAGSGIPQCAVMGAAP